MVLVDPAVLGRWRSPSPSQLCVRQTRDLKDGRGQGRVAYTGQLPQEIGSFMPQSQVQAQNAKTMGRICTLIGRNFNQKSLAGQGGHRLRGTVGRRRKLLPLRKKTRRQAWSQCHSGLYELCLRLEDAASPKGSCR